MPVYRQPAIGNPLVDGAFDWFNNLRFDTMCWNTEIAEPLTPLQPQPLNLP